MLAAGNIISQTRWASVWHSAQCILGTPQPFSLLTWLHFQKIFASLRCTVPREDRVFPAVKCSFKDLLSAALWGVKTLNMASLNRRYSSNTCELVLDPTQLWEARSATRDAAAPPPTSLFQFLFISGWFFLFWGFFSSFLGGWLRCSSSRGALVCWMVDVRLKPRGVGTASDRGGRQNGGREGGRGGGGGGGVVQTWADCESSLLRFVCLHLRLSLYLCHCLVFCLVCCVYLVILRLVLSPSFNFLFIPLCLFISFSLLLFHLSVSHFYSPPLCFHVCLSPFCLPDARLSFSLFTLSIRLSRCLFCPHVVFCFAFFSRSPPSCISLSLPFLYKNHRNREQRASTHSNNLILKSNLKEKKVKDTRRRWWLKPGSVRTESICSPAVLPTCCTFRRGSNSCCSFKAVGVLIETQSV